MSDSLSDPQYIEMIARLRAIRESKDISQQDLGDRIGKTQSYVSKVETCERRLDLVETLRICKALGIGIDEVIPSDFQP